MTSFSWNISLTVAECTARLTRTKACLCKHVPYSLCNCYLFVSANSLPKCWRTTLVQIQCLPSWFGMCCWQITKCTDTKALLDFAQRSGLFSKALGQHMKAASRRTAKRRRRPRSRSRTRQHGTRYNDAGTRWFVHGITYRTHIYASTS